MPDTLLVFDLDNTLAALASPIPCEALELLFALRRAGVELAIASGKPVYYLMGLCRQAGLSDIWLIGENGARLVYGVDLPPARRIALVSECATEDQPALSCLAKLRKEACERFQDRIWLQPNEAAVTFFFDSPETKAELEVFLRDRGKELRAAGLNVFRHSDSFDLLPDKVDKGVAVSFLKSYLNQGSEKEQKKIKRVVVVGDSENDAPMFEVADLALAIAYPDSRSADLHFRDFSAVKAYLEREILNV